MTQRESLRKRDWGWARKSLKKVEQTLSADKIYIVYKIEGAKVCLQQVCSYSGTPIKYELELKDFLEDWAATKQEAPIQMEDAKPQTPRSASSDECKCKIYMALLALQRKHNCDSNFPLCFWRRPDEVRTTKQVVANKLVLVPVVPLSYVSTKDNGTGHSFGKHAVGKEKQEYFAIQPAKPTFKPDEMKFPADVFLSVFWCVDKVAKQEHANMEFATIVEHGISIPVLENKKQIPAFTKLAYYKPVTRTRPLAAGAIIEGAPAKKVRST